MLTKFRNWMKMQQNKEQINHDIHIGLKKIKKIYDVLPERGSEAVEVLQEMRTGCQPDKSADYYENRKQIHRWLAEAELLKENVAKDCDSFNKLADKAANTFPKAHTD